MFSIAAPVFAFIKYCYASCNPRLYVLVLAALLAQMSSFYLTSIIKGNSIALWSAIHITSFLLVFSGPPMSSINK
jgi:hypothetical protein